MTSNAQFCHWIRTLAAMPLLFTSRPAGNCRCTIGMCCLDCVYFAAICLLQPKWMNSPWCATEARVSRRSTYHQIPLHLQSISKTHPPRCLIWMKSILRSLSDKHADVHKHVQQESPSLDFFHNFLWFNPYWDAETQQSLCLICCLWPVQQVVRMIKVRHKSSTMC